MQKLTRITRRQIERALYHLGRANDYVMSPTTAVTQRKSQSTTTLDYVRASDGAVLYEVERSYGSDLTGLNDARRILTALLDTAA
jgi:hypothetical protein